MDASDLVVTRHALDRYKERVEPCSDSAAFARLTSQLIVAAASFGAHYVRLPGNQRVVIKDATVITVLPAPQGERIFRSHH